MTKPRLLMLACYFPPVNAVGSVRTANVAKYLARAGWEVDVVTPAPHVWRPSMTNGVAPTANVRRLDTGYHWRQLSPGFTQCGDGVLSRFAGKALRYAARKLDIEAESGWIRAARRRLQELDPEAADLVLASASPFGSLALAAEVAQRLGVPYVLDYRDSWTRNPHIARPPSKRKIATERELVCNAAAVTVISESMREDFEQAYGTTNVHVLTNGFDPEEIAAVEPMPFERPAFVYSGSFYVPKRVIDPVFAALAKMKDEPSWQFHYFGNGTGLVTAAAQRAGIADRVVLHGRVERQTALAATKGATASVVITSVLAEPDPEDRGIITGKLFEVLGCGTPMLLVAPRDSDAAAIANGATHVSAGETDRMEAFFREALHDPSTRQPAAQEYAWPSIAARLDALLREAIG